MRTPSMPLLMLMDNDRQHINSGHPSPSGVNSPILASAAAAVTKQKKRAVAPLKVAKDPLIKTSKANGANFSLAESKELIQIVKNKLPKGQIEWMKVASVFNCRHSSDCQREWDALQNWFMSIRNTTRKLTANITQELRDEANKVSKILEEDAGYKSQKAQKCSRISLAVTSDEGGARTGTREEKPLSLHELELKRVEVEMLRLQAEEKAEERRVEEQRRRDEADQRAEGRRLNDGARLDSKIS
ncbi:hypothetical protein BC829DRAFT_460857 [Chytridium lagenaria]|nr:hypothetical protein BC829DRAFT_460857 [Chytridium lagenaria]